jgi:hypothetical protein
MNRTVLVALAASLVVACTYFLTVLADNIEPASVAIVTLGGAALIFARLKNHQA